MSAARFLVGIDLGTTNSALAYVDMQDDRTRAPRLRLFEVPQAVSAGEVEPRQTLPSFVYYPSGDPASAVVGVFAREQGALQPARQVSSSKSWLCHPAVDRTAAILPWGAEPPFVSPVHASAAILSHLRAAWNDVMAAGRDERRLEHQDVVLTVPASFDQEARELTLQAAREAGLERPTLLEEPLAAFYAWIWSSRRHRSSRREGGARGRLPFADEERVLVCDVGGGTSDFTLIRVRVEGDEVSFERTAVGEHLLLGGDNLDLALARTIERKLGDRPLALVQRLALRRSASAAKERLLADPPIERVPIAILGAGRAVVGGTLSTELTRQDVVDALLEGFLPLVEAGERPARDARAGLRELGLPYAGDPAITRHLAAFLQDAASAEQGRPGAGLARPDAVLFNGGFFTPAIARERILESIERWFDAGSPWRPRVLETEAPAAAVAQGAAYYAMVRRTGGLRVRAGSARTYYLGIGAPGTPALCILPRGTEEGTEFDMGDRALSVMTNRPVSFPLFSSTIRQDPLGALADLSGEEVHRHAPLATVLRYGKRTRQVELAVALSVAYTEAGTLEVSCASRTSEHRWRLRFQLRGERQEVAADDESPETESLIPPERTAAAEAAIRGVFGEGGQPETQSAGEAVTAEQLPAHIEGVLGYGRQAWPLAVIRALGDALLRSASGRRKGPRHEARWLNLTGFCLRPGFGAPLDDWRIEQVRRVYVEGLAFPSDQQCQVEWIVLWQRVAGGLRAGQQRELYQRYATVIGARAGEKPRRVNPQVQREAWRLLASLEHLSAAERAKLGEVLLDRLKRDADNASYLWAIGRLGARVPAHGPITAVVPPAVAEAWVERLLAFGTMTADTAGALVQIAGRSEDPLRDVSEGLREVAAARLEQAGFADEARSLQEVRPAVSRDPLQLFGESLPVGLRLG
jgi:molecular chaperone DnaK (HSP70)